MRENLHTIRALEEVQQRPVSYGQGLSVARRINALVYTECSSRVEEGGNITELFGKITKSCVLQDQQANQIRARKQRNRLSFARKLSGSKSDLKLSSVIETTFTIEGGQLLQPRAAFRVILPSRQQIHTGTEPPGNQTTHSDFKPRIETQTLETQDEWRLVNHAVDLDEWSIPSSLRFVSCGSSDAQSASVLYTFEMVAPDGRKFRIFRSRDAMASLRQHVLMVPRNLDPNGENGQKNAVPYLPLHATKATDQQMSYDKYRGQIARYIDWILQTPSLMSDKRVREFFAPRFGVDKELE